MGTHSLDFWNEADMLEHIVAYCALRDEAKANAYFETHLYHPFSTLAEIIYSRTKGFKQLGDLDDARQLALLYILKNISRFNPKKGRALSWFWQVVKNSFNRVHARNTRKTCNVSLNVPLEAVTEDHTSLFLAHAPWQQDQEAITVCENQRKVFLNYWTESNLTKHFRGDALRVAKHFAALVRGESRKGITEDFTKGYCQRTVCDVTDVSHQTVFYTLGKLTMLTAGAYRRSILTL